MSSSRELCDKSKQQINNQIEISEQIIHLSTILDLFKKSKKKDQRLLSGPFSAEEFGFKRYSSVKPNRPAFQSWGPKEEHHHLFFLNVCNKTMTLVLPYHNQLWCHTTIFIKIDH